MMEYFPSMILLDQQARRNEMETLISWSGDRSRGVAEALREWLPYVLQRVKPWMSAKDIYAGTRWAAELGTRLAQINFGIVCVTQENSNAPWVLFEAGALAKSLEVGHVVPVLFEMKSTDLEGPLSQFQAVEVNDEGMRSLILSLNQALPEEHRMTDERTRNTFEAWWPKLKKDVDEIPTQVPLSAMKPARSERELLEELLDISRRMAGTGELKELPTISDMEAALATQREMLNRKESGIELAEFAAERGGPVETNAPLRSIREAMSDTLHEQELYDAAILALKAIKNWRPIHDWR